MIPQEAHSCTVVVLNGYIIVELHSNYVGQRSNFVAVSIDQI